MIGLLTKSRIRIVVENYLSNTVTVAQVKKSHAPHFAHALHPSGKSYLFSGISKAEFTASVSSVHRCISCYFGFNNLSTCSLKTTIMQN